MNEPIKQQREPHTQDATPARLDPHTHGKLSKWRGCILFLIVFGVLLAGILYHHYDVVQVSEEAVIRSGVGSDLLAGLTAGRQGLIGSLMWAPLPTLVGLPFVYIPVLGASGLAPGQAGLAWPVLSAAASALTVVLLNRWLRRAHMHWLLRYLVLIAYQLSPPVLGAVLAGSGAGLLILFCVAGLHFLYDWITTLELRSLAYVGALAGLAVVSDWRMILPVVAVLLVVVLRLLCLEPRKSYAQATFLVVLLPVLYLVAVWTVSNWLIMGNPLFFLRGLFARASVMPTAWYAGLRWHVYVLPLIVLTLGTAFGRFAVRHALKARLYAGLLVLAMLTAVGLSYWAELRTDASYLEMYPQQVRTVDEIISFVEDRYPDSRVIVSGYFGYQFSVRAHKPDLFVHFINLSLPRVDRRTHGKELFLLLPRPKGTNTWEDIHLNHPGLFEDYEGYRMEEGSYVAGFVFEQRWPAGDGQPEWLLLRMILLNREAPDS